MRQTELHLADEDRELIEAYRTKGLHHAREVNRAHVLSALDRGVPESQIMAVLGITRTVIWRTRAAYLEGGAEYALHVVARPGKPRQYDAEVDAWQQRRNAESRRIEWNFTRQDADLKMARHYVS